MGHFAMGEPPFKETFLHGLIYGKSYWRDNPSGGITYVAEEERKAFDLGKKELPKDVKSRWEKMSKSKGNIIDPMEVIGEYGADAMRLALASSATDARQIDLDRRRFEEWRNFANKVWNGARFVLMNIQPHDLEVIKSVSLTDLSIEDRWILSRIEHVANSVSISLTKYAFDKAAQEAYDFYWNEFCAYYVELSKPAFFGKKGEAESSKKKLINLYVLLSAVRILHPFAPYITEELFQTIKKRFSSWLQHGKDEKISSILKEILNILSCDVVAETEFPSRSQYVWQSEEIEQNFARIQEAIVQIRAIRGEMKIAPSQSIELYVHDTHSTEFFTLLEKNKHIIEALIKISSIQFVKDAPHFAVESRAVVEGVSLIVPLPQEMRKQEIIRLEKEIVKNEEQKKKTEAQLSNQSFIERAPAQLVEKLRQTLKQLDEEGTVLKNQKERLEKEEALRSN